MHSNDFEEAFGHYLESKEYEVLVDALFAATRQAFLAGWLAADGDPPSPHRMYEVLPGRDACADPAKEE